MRPRSRWMHRVAQGVALTFLAGCDARQSALHPNGPEAHAIAQSWWVMLSGAVLILALVTALGLYATFRSSRREPPLRPVRFTVIGGVVFPVVVLTALLFYGTLTTGHLRVNREPPGLRIEVIGAQWWWEMNHLDGDSRVRTLNELHLPAGVAVEVLVGTRDVIHSFWIPNLAGKIDLIPGRTNRIRLQADEPGRFRGQCAEFCGLAHAHMTFDVIVHDADAFDAWMRTQASAPARAP